MDDVATQPTHGWSMYAGSYDDGATFVHVGDARYVRFYGHDTPHPVVVREDESGRYHGWIAKDGDRPVMIQPNETMFSGQFQYGPQVEVDRGNGRHVRLSIEAR